MAIIISYPTEHNILLSDRLLGTKYDEELGTSTTKNFTVGDIVSLATQNTLSTGVSGYFETADLKGVTVTNGLITNIQIIG